MAKKNNKSGMKKVIIGVIMIGLIVGYYSYLSHKQDKAREDAFVENTELSKLISRKLDGAYYPEFPQSVVEFYSRIVQAYYFTEIADEEIEALGAQARKLFDDELLEKNPEDVFLANLKLDIMEYNKSERKVYSFTIEDIEDIDKFVFEDRQYAVVTVGYLMREKSTVNTIYHDYTLRKDSNGDWKILFWKQAEVSEEDE